MHKNKMYAYLLLATIIVAAGPAQAGGGPIPGVDIAAAFGGSLISMESNRVRVEIGNVDLRAYLQNGDCLAVNSGYFVPALLPWGFDRLRAQLPVVATGLQIKSAQLLVAGHQVGAWLPESRAFDVPASDYAAIYRRMLGEQAAVDRNVDPTVLPPLDHEAVFVIANGERREYTVFLIFKGVGHRDVAESAGFTLQCLNTTGWNPLMDRDFHRSTAELQAEVESWWEEEITGFAPYSLNPERAARARRRNQQVRDGSCVRVRVRYEEPDGSLCKFMIPKGTCLYWWVPEELVLSDTQLAVSPQHIPGQRYTLLPEGQEPSPPSNWAEPIKALVKGLRCVAITRTVYTGAEVQFELPFGVIDLAPALQRQLTGPDGKLQPVTLANFLALGTSQAWPTGEAFLWQYVDGGDLLSFATPPNRPTDLLVRLRARSGSAAEPATPAAPAPRDDVPAIGLLNP